MIPEDVHRRRANKRFNERVKLLATLFNNTGIATLVGGFLLPIFNGSRMDAGQALVIFGFAAVAHMIGQIGLTLYRSEDWTWTLCSFFQPASSFSGWECFYGFGTRARRRTAASEKTARTRQGRSHMRGIEK